MKLSLLLFAWCLYPSLEYLEKHEEKIEAHCPVGPYFREWAQKEADAHFCGYHATSISHRIFQDILRVTIEHLLKIPVPDDFHFLRIPGDPFYDTSATADHFLATISPQHFNDRKKEHMAKLISLNISLFGNYWDPRESTITIFHQEGRQDSLIAPLEDFFQAIGLEPIVAQELWKKGHEMASESDITGGVLLQFFIPEEHLDAISYVSLPFGIPVKHLPPSETIRSDLRSPAEADLQLRMIISNQETLNPNGPLKIVRYDFFPKEFNYKLTKEFKSLLDTHSPNPVKLKMYKERLLQIWNKGQDSDKRVA